MATQTIFATNAGLTYELGSYDTQEWSLESASFDFAGNGQNGLLFLSVDGNGNGQGNGQGNQPDGLVEVGVWYLDGARTGYQGVQGSYDPEVWAIRLDLDSADTNGDGSEDILFTSESQIGIWQTNPAGGIPTYKGFNYSSDSNDNIMLASTGDIDGSGTDDLIFYNPQSDGTAQIGAWYMDAAGNPGLQVWLGTYDMDEYLYTGSGDLNGDGTTDFGFIGVGENAGNQYAWLMGTNPGEFLYQGEAPAAVTGGSPDWSLALA